MHVKFYIDNWIHFQLWIKSSPAFRADIFGSVNYQQTSGKHGSGDVGCGKNSLLDPSSSSDEEHSLQSIWGQSRMYEEIYGMRTRCSGAQTLERNH